MEEQVSNADSIGEELVELVFLKQDSDDVEFTVDIPTKHFDMIVEAAEAEGITVQDKIIEILLNKTKEG